MHERKFLARLEDGFARSASLVGSAAGHPEAQLSIRTMWTEHNFDASVGGGAQMFAYDFDGNGTNDVFTSRASLRRGGVFAGK